MLKALRWPLLALFFSVVLLAVALFISYGEDDPAGPDTTPEVNATATVSIAATPTVGVTPIATVSVAGNVLAPVPGQLTEAMVGNIQKLNPLFASFNPVDRDISSLIFEGLTTINDYGEIVPDLAERWEVSQDGLEYVFLLRRDVLWQDGLPFTSADVRFTIDTIRDPDFVSDPSLTDFWRTVEMTVIDEYTIRFRLVQPLASFPEQLRIGMLPKHALEGYPVADLYRHPFNLTPIGTGPYQREFLYADRGQFSISLRVAPTYRQRPEGQDGYAIDRIVFRTYSTLDEAIAALARGEVNSISSLPPERLSSLNSLSTLAVYTTIAPSLGVLIYNWQREQLRYLQNERVRLALAEATDRYGAVTRALGGQALPADSPLIPGSWAYDAGIRLPAYNLSAAESTLSGVNLEEVVAASTAEATPVSETPTDEATPADETTDETPSTAVRREFTILVRDTPTLVALANDIAQQWNQLGFTVSAEPVDDVTYQQRLINGDFDTAIVEYSFAPYADPDSYAFWHVSQVEDGVNYGAMKDFRISEVLEDARREQLGLNRVALYREFQRLFADRVPALTLYYPLYVYATDRRLIGMQLGFITTPADRFRTIQNWNWELP